MLLLSQVPSKHTCPKLTLFSASVHIINPVSQRIHFFSTLVYRSNRQLTDMENGLHLMTFTVSLMKCGAIAPLFIHVLLLPWGNTLALCLSLEIFFEVVDLGG